MRIRRGLFFGILQISFFFLLLIPNASMAQTGLTLVMCSQQIPGQSVLQRYEGCLDIVSLGETLNVDVTVTNAFQTTAPTISPIRFSKAIDATTPVWRQYLLEQRDLNDVQFVALVPDQSNGGALQAQLTLTLILARVSSVSMTLSETGQVVEVIGLLPAKIRWQHVDGATFEYDLTQQKAN